MIGDSRPVGAEGTWVYVRYGHDSRLHRVMIEPQMAASRPDIVLVEDHGGAVLPARMVGEVDPNVDGTSEGRVVGGYNIDSQGTQRLSDLVDVHVTADHQPLGHRWGSLGLPHGPDSRVSPVHQSLQPDDAYALNSRGYIESTGERIHQLVPGDIVVLRKREATVAAIDRRGNTIELRDANDETTLMMPLDEFLEEERR